MNGFLGSSAVTISENFEILYIPTTTVCQLLKETTKSLQVAYSFIRYHGSAPDNICVKLEFGNTWPLYPHFTLFISQQDMRPCQRIQFKMIIFSDDKDPITIDLSSESIIKLPENTRRILIQCKLSENAEKTNTVTFKVEPCV